MSEWDYLPTPYESLVQDEENNLMLILLSICCISQNRVLKPFEIFELYGSNELITDLLDRFIDKIGFQDFLRTLLQYEEIKSEKKRNEVLKIINRYQNVKRTRTKNL